MRRWRVAALVSRSVLCYSFPLFSTNTHDLPIQMIGTWLSELHQQFRGTPLVQSEWSFLLPVSRFSKPFSPVSSSEIVLLFTLQPVPQQEDSSNCGVFMLQHIEAICRIQDLGAVCNQPAPRPQARLHMAVELAQHRLQRRVPTDDH